LGETCAEAEWTWRCNLGSPIASPGRETLPAGVSTVIAEELGFDGRDNSPRCFVPRSDRDGRVRIWNLMSQPKRPLRPAAATVEANCAASIVLRQYLSDLRPAVADELSVRIEHEGRHAFFPLGTNRRKAAMRKGEAIRRVIAAAGWSGSTGRFIREFTLAVFWLPNPLTCTYATLFTALARPNLLRKPRNRRARLILYEPERAIRWGLMAWLNLLPDFECVAAHDSVPMFLKDVKRTRPDLVLFNDPPCAPASEPLQERLVRECPEQVGFPYGIYRDSEHAWYSVTGVDGGYYYRRRPPAQLLEPISGLWPSAKPGREWVESRIRHHLRTLFSPRVASPEAIPGLTNRERDVLLGLRQGHTDKTLATTLGISSWTVHSHMKSLFDKLGVHTRAEAVARFFEK